MCLLRGRVVQGAGCIWSGGRLASPLNPSWARTPLSVIKAEGHNRRHVWSPYDAPALRMSRKYGHRLRAQFIFGINYLSSDAVRIPPYPHYIFLFSLNSKVRYKCSYSRSHPSLCDPLKKWILVLEYSLKCPWMSSQEDSKYAMKKWKLGKTGLSCIALLVGYFMIPPNNPTMHFSVNSTQLRAVISNTAINTFAQPIINRVRCMHCYSFDVASMHLKCITKYDYQFIEIHKSVLDSCDTKYVFHSFCNLLSLFSLQKFIISFCYFSKPVEGCWILVQDFDKDIVCRKVTLPSFKQSKICLWKQSLERWWWHFVCHFVPYS